MGRYWNNQRYYECQLIALWNAAIYYDIPVPERYGEVYVWACERAHALSGGCIQTGHVISALGLSAVPGDLTWEWVCNHLPIEFKIFCHRGYHSVLGIDIKDNPRRVLLTNYAYDRTYWLRFDTLVQKHNKHAKPIQWSRA